MNTSKNIPNNNEFINQTKLPFKTRYVGYPNDMEDMVQNTLPIRERLYFPSAYDFKHDRCYIRKTKLIHKDTFNLVWDTVFEPTESNTISDTLIEETLKQTIELHLQTLLKQL